MAMALVRVTALVAGPQAQFAQGRAKRTECRPGLFREPRSFKCAVSKSDLSGQEPLFYCAGQ